MTILAALTERLQAHAVELVRVGADFARDDTKAHASRRTGDLAEGISHTEPALTDTYVSCEIVSAVDYAGYQDEGTGIYGPRGAPIVVMPGEKPMTFYWPAVGGWRSLRESRGSPGKHYFREPMPERWHDSLAKAIRS